MFGLQFSLPQLVNILVASLLAGAFTLLGGWWTTRELRRRINVIGEFLNVDARRRYDGESYPYIRRDDDGNVVEVGRMAVVPTKMVDNPPEPPDDWTPPDMD